MMQDAITVLRNIEKVQALLSQAIGLLGGAADAPAATKAPTAPAKRRGRPPKSKNEDLDL